VQADAPYVKLAQPVAVFGGWAAPASAPIFPLPNLAPAI